MKLRLKSTRLVKLVPQKIGFESLSFQFFLPSKWIIFKVQRLKMITFQVKKKITRFTHKKELRRSDFLFDGGYVGAKVPLLSTSKNKKEIKGKITQFHNSKK